jgi:tetratricopeptide (TPR) repeat protein
VKLSAGILLLLATVATGQTMPQATPQTPPQSFEQLSAKAQQAYNANQDDEAVRLYSEAVKLKPEWAEGWWALGMIDYQHDRYPQCREKLSRMVALDSSAAPGWALLGLCEFSTKEYDSAFEHLKKAHMLVPVKEAVGQLLLVANYHLAILLTRQGAFELAQEILVLHVAPTSDSTPEMMLAGGVASLRMPILPSEVPSSQHDVVAMAGKAFWDLASRPPEEAESDFKSLLAAYPNFPNVHYFYGTFLGARHPEQSPPEFLAELRVSPDSVPTRVQLALRYVIEGKTAEALKYAKEAVALSPDSVGAQLALGEALRSEGDDEHALAVYLAAERLDPVSPKIRLYLANTYRALGRSADMRREQAEYSRLKSEQQNWP